MKSSRSIRRAQLLYLVTLQVDFVNAKEGADKGSYDQVAAMISLATFLGSAAMWSVLSAHSAPGHAYGMTVRLCLHQH